MGSMAFFEALIERKLMDLRCGYIGKVLETDGVTAKVQPLGMIKDGASGAVKSQAVVSNVPVACKYKFKEKIIKYTDADGNPAEQKIVVPTMIEAGDLVACLCADRDITAARTGGNVLPPYGRHSISDSIIVGIIEK